MGFTIWKETSPLFFGGRRGYGARSPVKLPSSRTVVELVLPHNEAADIGGRNDTAKIQLVNGSRVEIFSRPLRKNTTRPLTGWIGGTGKEKITFHCLK